MPDPLEAVVLSLGQSDGWAFDPTTMGAEEFVRTYIKAMLLVSKRLRTEAAGERWREVPCFIQLIGWMRLPTTREVYDPPGFMLVRLAQTLLVERYGASHNLQLGPVQTYWEDLHDEVHPTLDADCRLAAVAGMMISKSSLGAR